MSFPFFDDMPETTEPPRLRVVEAPERKPQYRITTRGWVVLWVLWMIVAYFLSPVAEFWWTKI